MTTKDQRIKKWVVAQLYWDPLVDASRVKVEVSQGRVKLTGTVPSLTALKAAELDVRNVPSITTVENKLSVTDPAQVPRGWADEEIKDEVARILWANPNIDVTKMTVSVNEGAVILEGSVDVYWKKLLAENLAHVRGVRRIRNKLSVVPSKQIDDRITAQHAIRAVARSLHGCIESVTVKVEGGKATLSGAVPSREAYVAVCKAAQYTEGVGEVDSKDLVVSR
jgi:osmotically-inducible protein OsmY